MLTTQAGIPGAAGRINPRDDHHPGPAASRSHRPGIAQRPVARPALRLERRASLRPRYSCPRSGRNASCRRRSRAGNEGIHLRMPVTVTCAGEDVGRKTRYTGGDARASNRRHLRLGPRRPDRPRPLRMRVRLVLRGSRRTACRRDDHFVLNTHSKQTVGIEFHLLAIAIDARTRIFRARHLVIDRAPRDSPLPVSSTPRAPGFPLTGSAPLCSH